MDSQTTDQKIKVLLGDRHTLVREGLGRILAADTNIEVVGLTGDGREAVELMARLQPEVVVLDAGLPGIEEAVRHLTTTPGVAVLILSENGGLQQALNLLRAGATGYLDKDTDSQSLIAAVHRVRQGEMTIEPSLVREMVDCLVHGKPQVIDEGDALREVLSEREMKVLRLLCQGYTDKEIAQALYLSVRTVNSHLSHIYAKLGVHSRTEAMRVALEKGWVSLSIAFPLLMRYPLMTEAAKFFN